MARGKILAWLNADDIYAPSAISTAVSWLQRHSEIGLVYSDYDVIDKEGTVQYIAKALDFEPDQLFLCNAIGQVTAFWSRHVLDRVGELDENLHYAMDYDLWLRIALVFPVKRIPDRCLASFRIYPGTKTSSNPQGWAPEIDRILERVMCSKDFATLPGTVQERARASALRHRGYRACFQNKPTLAADYFRQASLHSTILRDRDIEMLLLKLADCIASPLVPDAVSLMRNLFEQSLPCEIAALRSQVFAHVHLAYALRFFQAGEMQLARKHMLHVFRCRLSALANRGYVSMLFQTFSGLSRLRDYLRGVTRSGMCGYGL